MKSFVCGTIAVGCLLFACPESRADEAQDFHDYYSYFQATWIFEFDDGTESVVVCSDRTTYNLVQVSGQYTEMWGYDPVQKMWTGYGFGNAGRWEFKFPRPTGEAIEAGTKWNFDGTTWLANGTKIVSKQTFTCIDADHFEVRGTQQTEGDEQLSKFGIRARRITSRMN